MVLITMLSARQSYNLGYSPVLIYRATDDWRWIAVKLSCSMSFIPDIDEPWSMTACMDSEPIKGSSETEVLCSGDVFGMVCAVIFAFLV